MDTASLPPRIHFIIMGGTIDSDFSPSNDAVVPKSKSIIPTYIKNLQLKPKTIFTTVCLKDSRQLAREDLQKMAKAIEDSPAVHLIVTHGTYTMSDSARYAELNVGRKDQVIIFTGSMIPLDGFKMSDASFNLGFALAKLAMLDAGVYVCMNGEVLTAGESNKFIQNGKFESLFEKKR